MQFYDVVVVVRCVSNVVIVRQNVCHDGSAICVVSVAEKI